MPPRGALRTALLLLKAGLLCSPWYLSIQLNDLHQGRIHVSVHCPTLQGSERAGGQVVLRPVFQSKPLPQKETGLLGEVTDSRVGAGNTQIVPKSKEMLKKQKDGACQRRHRSHPERAPKGHRWSNLNNK